jgi:hypothetical protein
MRDNEWWPCNAGFGALRDGVADSDKAENDDSETNTAPVAVADGVANATGDAVIGA